MREQMHEQAAELLRPLTTLAGALAPLAERMHELGRALSGMREGEGQLVRLQTLLAQNLETLAAAGSFEEAVHSLTAAAHLLTARGGMKHSLRLHGDGQAAA